MEVLDRSGDTIFRDMKTQYDVAWTVGIAFIAVQAAIDELPELFKRRLGDRDSV